MMTPESDPYPRSRWWTISNVLSCSRIILTIPIAVLLLEGTLFSRLWAIVIMLVAVLTDFLDGYLARRRNEVTELGKIIDPLADKISVAVIASILTAAGYIPVWFFILVLTRDIIILAGGLWLLRVRNIVLQSTWTGKWAVNAIAATIVMATFNLQRVMDILIVISCILIFWSLVVYGRRFGAVVRNKV